ncbi:hypothetical protein POM88_052589 [Heracleum sosnowskyi]|uniref:Uncharacterized protein n=1 Tax=Heracleum sosnowskyi TaxID=360622 RepID=A0AAD8GS19_9APIA|nr:hypothetical protein POM88_052589 [Heracleum sosnowskyi]
MFDGSPKLSEKGSVDQVDAAEEKIKPATAKGLVLDVDGEDCVETPPPPPPQNLEARTIVFNHGKQMAEVVLELVDPSEVDRSDSHTRHHFFDDRPGAIQEPRNTTNNVSLKNSLLVLVPGIDPKHDVSLKLSTGIRCNPESGSGEGNGEESDPSCIGELHRAETKWVDHWLKHLDVYNHLSHQYLCKIRK